ncbi:uncharacterized protein PV06_08203 [Exophiala oligosperma]|uniref:Uncharacterized protein n=1 Tax=Exophiala oligosperma TaxID=215243 RepID=A0A0D2DAZ7_9EURO|nr:uncharacterized protein PV06_08203 [Exophiala oligosperma]KIW39605.1 hypothetical protein PV06_08203 [Exophiala oligosperma]
MSTFRHQSLSTGNGDSSRGAYSPASSTGNLGLAEQFRCEAADYVCLDIAKLAPRPNFSSLPGLWTSSMPIVHAGRKHWMDEYIDPFIPRRHMFLLGLKSGHLLVDYVEGDQGTPTIKARPPLPEEKKRNPMQEYV